MKIVIISPYLLGMNRGIERFTYSIANELAEQGNEITIYIWKSNLKVNWGKWHQKVKIRTVPTFRYYIRLFASVYYRYWLHIDNPDRVILNFLYHGEDKLPNQYKYIYVLNSPASQVPHRYSFIKKLLSKFHHLQFVAVSKMVAREAKPFIEDRKITVIPNGVDTNKFRPSNITRSSSDSVIKLISAAALEERKGLQNIINTIGQHPDISITYDIFGDGPYKKALQIIIEKYGLQGKVRINSPVNNLETVLPEYDIFCLPSKGEAFALAPVEALSCGIPVLVSKHPPYDELIDGPFGMCIDEADHVEIMKGILYLARIKREKPEIIRQAALKYDWKNITSEYLKLLTP